MCFDEARSHSNPAVAADAAFSPAGPFVELAIHRLLNGRAPLRLFEASSAQLSAKFHDLRDKTFAGALTVLGPTTFGPV